ncbi:MAG: acyltransferase, partial [Bacteroidetes bacterium]|nr:acyltransferase [Bacteroidota bacterium]
MSVKLYFKNLDGIRFIASFLVLFHHACYLKRNYSPGFAIVDGTAENLGRIGVNLFFVLSGFLISYLLLVEKDKTGDISYRNFYLRRILRIWPLYLGYGLLLTFVSPYIASHLGFGGAADLRTTLINLVFLLLFSVNIQLALLGSNPGMFEISWSVCIEEQFYLIWPVLINRYRKKIFALLTGMFFLTIAVRIALCIVWPIMAGAVDPKTFLFTSYNTNNSFNYLLTNYMLIFDKLDLFGGGLLIAWLLYNRERYEGLFARLFLPGVQVLMTVLFFVYIFSVFDPSNTLYFIFGDHLVSVVLYGYVLLAAVADNSIYRLENPLFKTLGKISYGIYLFHTAVLQFSLVL